MANILNVSEDIINTLSVYGVNNNDNEMLLATYGYISWVNLDNGNDFDLSRNVDLLLEQFEKATGLQGILQNEIEEYNEVKKEMRELAKNLSLFFAYGKQLDILGNIVGEHRLGRNDVEYRAAIIERVLLNVGSGEIEKIILGLKLIFNANYIEIKEYYPAKIRVILSDLDYDAKVKDVMKYLKSAGVGIEIDFVSSGLIFSFDKEGSLQGDIHSGGFDELNYGSQTAGKIVEKIL